MLKKFLYILSSILVAFLFFYEFSQTSLTNFVDGIENKTFDVRQRYSAKNKQASKDIILVTIDDASYEYALDNIGEWPLPRGLYADVVDFIETQNPKLIAFDMLFVKSAKNNAIQDKKLANVFKKYDNIITAMNFDYQPTDLRIPQELPKKLTFAIKSESKTLNFEENTFTNYRPIIDEIIKNTDNIGTVNISRSDDGVLRKAPVLVKYFDDLYPQMAFLVSYKAINNTFEKELLIDEKNNIILKNKKLPMDKDGNVILNWYGKRGNYKEVPLYKIIKKMNGENVELNTDFNNKIVFIGITANSLFDIKTTPTDQLFPGVEALATYTNNVLDNNFIQKSPTCCTIIFSLLLAIIIGLIVIKCSSVALIIGLSTFTYAIYTILTFQLMKHCNIWLELVSPLLFATLVFITMLIVKYIIKSKDFDQQYKLATTDGLTGLYNHRYFQEQMTNALENAKRYESNFSLIIIDIDYFKKFNDNFGHQCGDRVLKTVAQTLRKNVRATDIVCRYGGEEMSIILPNINHDDAIFTAEKLCKIISELDVQTSNDKTTNVTISLGVSTFPQDGQNTQDLIKIADNRLYNAKENGRNQVGQ